VGQSVTLSASCSGSPTSYVWTNCSSTSSTCVTTAAAAGAATYYVAGVNAYGKGDPPAGVVVTWQAAGGGGGGGGGGGPSFCGSYNNVNLGSIGWGDFNSIKTSLQGGFAGDGVWVIAFTVPTSPSSYETPGSAVVGEYAGPTSFRQITLSNSPCDFRAPDPSGTNGPFTWGNGTSASVTWNVGAPPVSLVPGGTYYVSIRNWSIDLAAFSCTGECNAIIQFNWPK
jgi:hypothetical protein